MESILLYEITSRCLHDNDGKPVKRYIKAFSESSAWGKFRRQYFGVLKPNRIDYTVKQVKHDKEE